MLATTVIAQPHIPVSASASHQRWREVVAVLKWWRVAIDYGLREERSGRYASRWGDVPRSKEHFRNAACVQGG